jgi:DNA-binding PadR family transcriptional regulator
MRDHNRPHPPQDPHEREFGPEPGRPGFGGPRRGHMPPGPRAPIGRWPIPGFPPGGGFGPGMGGFGATPRAPRGGVRLGLLALIDENPRKGYSLMQAFSEKTAGNWQPKSGSIYPALNQLLAEDLVVVDEAGTYTLSDSGKSLLDANRTEAETMFQRLNQAEAKSELFASTFKLLDALRQTGSLDETDQADVVAKLDELRKDIYRKLAK